MTIDRKQIAMGGLLLLIVLSLPLILVNGYQLRLVNFVGINILLVLGLNFVLGYAGLLSFAQVGFFLIGAYTGGILSSDYGISFWLALPLAAIASGLCAWLVGVPTLRLRGHYFAFATFAFAETVRLVALNLELTHGASGLVGIPAPKAWSFSIDSDASFFYLILVFVIAAIVVAARIQYSAIGRALFAIREGELAAESMGINTAKTKMQAFVLSAVFAGVAGALYGPLNSVVSPDVFSFDVSVVVLVSLLLGGSGSIAGALIGTTLVTLLPEWLRVLQDYYMVVYGAGIVLLMIFLPDGLQGVVQSIRGTFRRQTTASTSPAHIAGKAKEA
jgi:branched-chain amino acid transport system permease protein